MKCATCRKELKEGMDVFEFQEGIISTSGMVPLDKEFLFCTVQCLKDFFNGSKGYVHWPRRIA